MATFTVSRDIKAKVGPFSFDIIAGVTQSCPDDLIDEVVEIIEGTSGGFIVTQLTTDRAEYGVSAATASTIASGYITAHSISADPHTVYATNADLTTHEGAADPHTGYQKESEKAAASGYASLDGSTLVPVAQLGSGSADSTKFLRGDRTWGTPVDTAGSFVGAVIVAATTQTTGASSFVAVSFTSAVIDTSTFFTSSQPTRLTIAAGTPTAVYDIVGGISFAASTAGDTRQVRIRKNGTTYLQGFTSAPPGGATGQKAYQVHVKAQLVATDYIELISFQDTAGSLDIGSTASDAWNVLGISRIGTV